MARKTKSIRPTASRSKGAGDDLGAAELGRRVAENLRARRHQKGFSLDELATQSGVSRAALSQVETGKSNPTLALLWKVAVGLGVPFADLVGEPTPGAHVQRYADAQVLRSPDGRFESRPLMPAGAGPALELYELKLKARSVHASDAHAAGTFEILLVLSGALKLTIREEVYELRAGDSIAFEAADPHRYENPGGSDARYINVIAYAR